MAGMLVGERGRRRLLRKERRGPGPARPGPARPGPARTTPAPPDPHYGDYAAARYFNHISAYSNSSGSEEAAGAIAADTGDAEEA